MPEWRRSSRIVENCSFPLPKRRSFRNLRHSNKRVDSTEKWHFKCGLASRMRKLPFDCCRTSLSPLHSIHSWFTERIKSRKSKIAVQGKQQITCTIRTWRLASVMLQMHELVKAVTKESNPGRRDISASYQNRTKKGIKHNNNKSSSWYGCWTSTKVSPYLPTFRK